MKKLLYTIILFTVPLLLSAKLTVDSILASVNGEPITLMDVLLESSAEEAKLRQVYSGQELYNKVRDLRKSIVDRIIDRKLVYEEYKTRPFNIPDQFVEDMLNRLAEGIGDGTRKGLEERAVKAGLSIEDLKTKARKKIAVDIIVNEYCKRPAYVTPKDVYDYYEKNKAEFSIEEKLKLQILFVKRDGRFRDQFKSLIPKLKEEINNADAKTFTSLIALYAEDPEKVTDGKTEWTPESELRPEFKTSLPELKKNKIVGPIDTKEGIFFIKLTDTKEKEILTFKQVRDTITEMLKKKLREEMYKKYIDKLKKKAFIRYYF